MPHDNATLEAVSIDQSEGNFSFPEAYSFDAGYGLSETVIDYISDAKQEAEWVRDFRKRALKIFLDKPMPTHWASSVSAVSSSW